MSDIDSRGGAGVPDDGHMAALTELTEKRLSDHRRSIENALVDVEERILVKYAKLNEQVSRLAASGPSAPRRRASDAESDEPQVAAEAPETTEKLAATSAALAETTQKLSDTSDQLADARIEVNSLRFQMNALAARLEAVEAVESKRAAEPAPVVVADDRTPTEEDLARDAALTNLFSQLAESEREGATINDEDLQRRLDELDARRVAAEAALIGQLNELDARRSATEATLGAKIDELRAALRGEHQEMVDEAVRGIDTRYSLEMNKIVADLMEISAQRAVIEQSVAEMGATVAAAKPAIEELTASRDVMAKLTYDMEQMAPIRERVGRLSADMANIQESYDRFKSTAERQLMTLSEAVTEMEKVVNDQSGVDLQLYLDRLEELERMVLETMAEAPRVAAAS